jgi:hypothetical protein
VRRFLVVPAALLATSGAALATAPAVIPPSTLSRLESVLAMTHESTDFLFVPTWAPRRYGLEGDGLGRDSVGFILTDSRVRGRPGFLKRSMVFSTGVYTGSLKRCAAAKPPKPPASPDTVLWNGTVAWRCVRAPDGRVVRVYAYGPGLSKAQLERVVRSVKPATFGPAANGSGSAFAA